jgi:hypothetical protein
MQFDCPRRELSFLWTKFSEPLTQRANRGTLPVSRNSEAIGEKLDLKSDLLMLEALVRCLVVKLRMRYLRLFSSMLNRYGRLK